ncbi:hypothetical protein CVU82_03585 [Candidatus Falkowbacteria bacterium HGW-Falkowbacteria-1]|jgi:cytochrome b involved in lipid metabolism|uniref:Cytochrome b5 heme-binding domain-containing protein n=1 Tax=Candidatus Falkowbacteria bacterium HGW-Falkowbacteria-1 TaxID=2013768 RepID=A0A2N2E8P4_9BACT|nr:MAG: hypothetical protein CVU82_03585 [Candidatus Falkowbacteria bacterium HGW-Falkowbacteria-1]
MKNFQFRIIAVLFLSFFLVACGKNVQTSQTTPKTDPNNQAQSLSPGDASAVYSLEEVMVHNNESDCWQIVDGKVYNLVSYIPNHPGGKGQILKWCGKDASEIFNLQHNPKTKALLVDYYLGDLK